MSSEKNVDPRVQREPEGFYKLKAIPSADDLKKYYQEKYFQSGKEYTFNTSNKELKFTELRLELKLYALEKTFPGLTQKADRRALEVGVGEGFTLRGLKNRGFRVSGLDFSDFAVKKVNPDLLPDFRSGEVYDMLDELVAKGEKFDLVWLDNVLEHTFDPAKLLNVCRALTHQGGALVLEVPNDFSPTQQFLLESGAISDSFWVTPPDHICYFNKLGLDKLAAKCGWKSHLFFSDFPIDFYLFNEHTNYRKTPSVGKSCHLSRVDIETLMMAQGFDKALDIFKALAEAGMGRQLVGVFSRG